MAEPYHQSFGAHSTHIQNPPQVRTEKRQPPTARPASLGTRKKAPRAVLSLDKQWFKGGFVLGLWGGSGIHASRGSGLQCRQSERDDRISPVFPTSRIPKSAVLHRVRELGYGTGGIECRSRLWSFEHEIGLQMQAVLESNRL